MNDYDSFRIITFIDSFAGKYSVLIPIDEWNNFKENLK